MYETALMEFESTEDGSFEILDFLDYRYRDDIASDTRKGLSASPKYLPCKYFYDEKGSKLFEAICHLPEYYLTRKELGILTNAAPEIMDGCTNLDLVELGSGANWKIQVLLEAARKTERTTMRYIPLDVSESAITRASKELIEKFPELTVIGIKADFNSSMEVLKTDRPMMLCFLGSTIGNLDDEKSISLLQNIGQVMKSEDTVLVGFDMVKNRETLEAAYNDSEGITSEFNRNILTVINNELGANFVTDDFEHLAFFDEKRKRVELHLKACRECTVRLESLDMEVSFDKGETIHTENSRKYTNPCIESLSMRAGFHIEERFTDEDGWFSLVLMRPKSTS